MAVDVAGVAVVVSHEGFCATKDAALGVVKGGGDDALELEGEDVCGFPGVEVELVADAHEEVVGLLDFFEGVCGDEAFVDEVFEASGAGFDVGDPEDVLIVA